jgi:hypothetical protein
MCCEKCGKMFGLMAVAVGILFLLKDVGVWKFWNITVWTVVFILGGFECKNSGCCQTEKSEKKKK